MSIYLKLFLTFLEIGAFSFGGGYAMLSVIREKCINLGWLTEESIMNFIAVAESTPGPIAINMATFVGSSQAGILGAICATIGVVLPSFCIILLIAAIVKNLLKYSVVQKILSGIRPVVIGLIVATGATMLLTVLTGITNIKSNFNLDYKSIIIFAILFSVAFIYKKITKKKFSHILMILLSAVLGIAFFS